VTKTHHELILPDLDLPDVPVVASIWHIPLGGEVMQGESVLEILAGDVTVDLPAPADGVLIQRLVAEDEPLQTGQVLAVILSSPHQLT
jgi:pyruvate/2-oxoglutarate dehydrogenase complex dihydrolipoamide acyltransferase (E2) component